MKFSPTRCPITAAFLRDFESQFGQTERIHMRENGVENGEPSKGDYVVPALEPLRNKLKKG